MKIILLFMIVVLCGMVVVLIPFAYLCIALKTYSFILFSVMLLPVCFYGIYQGVKEFRRLTLNSLHEQLPFLKK